MATNDNIIHCLYIMVLGKNLDIKNFYRRWVSEIENYSNMAYVKSIRASIKNINHHNIKKDSNVSLHEFGHFIGDHLGFDI